MQWDSSTLMYYGETTLNFSIHFDSTLALCIDLVSYFVYREVDKISTGNRKIENAFCNIINEINIRLIS